MSNPRHQAVTVVARLSVFFSFSAIHNTNSLLRFIIFTQTHVQNKYHYNILFHQRMKISVIYLIAFSEFLCICIMQ